MFKQVINQMKDIVAGGKDYDVDAKKFLQNKNPIVILYELQGCPHCTAIEEPWANSIKHLKNNKQVSPYVDCANAIYYYDKGMKAKGKKSRLDHLPKELRGISGFPTIHIIKNGVVIDEYSGDRTESSIIEFVEKFVENGDMKKVKSAPTPAKSAKSAAKPAKKKKALSV